MSLYRFLKNSGGLYLRRTSCGGQAASTITTLTSRRVIRISGVDSESFLQGLITNDISYLPSGDSVEDSGNKLQYSYFLNHKGRAVCDVFIKREEVDSNSGSEAVASFLLDCRSDAFPVLSKLLKMYRLRSKVKIKEEKDMKICVYGSYNGSDGKEYSNNVKKMFDVDPRSPIFGFRGFMPKDFVHSNEDEIQNESKEMEYNYFLRLQGMLEGVEMSGLIPLECNLDSINGVNFEKGCYVGQELTARTHFTGLVRKLCFPVYFKQIALNRNQNEGNEVDVTFPTSFIDIRSSLAKFTNNPDGDDTWASQASSLVNFSILPSTEQDKDNMKKGSKKKEKPINLFVDERKVGKLILPPLSSSSSFPPIGVALIRIDMVSPSVKDATKKIVLKGEGRIDIDENLEVVPFKPAY